ncbi:hypothetical protein BDK51DRAFT_29624 [Blyttiomyces helicus]|uniref:Uncharacterized protein n=1 Tax=Blyttiomyces helicus TaxID=388810 RepID=A0A4P9WRU0_9FUNG|nr:hypothetical protein BDK51DRAFT_29624 [Blyttiomyces helicus]|eukprot:RKO94628.1 hypothetical protein BDK51DRAFT_29624 [Blyttiomyces helicus]
MADNQVQEMQYESALAAAVCGRVRKVCRIADLKDAPYSPIEHAWVIEQMECVEKVKRFGFETFTDEFCTVILGHHGATFGNLNDDSSFPLVREMAEAKGVVELSDRFPYYYPIQMEAEESMKHRGVDVRRELVNSWDRLATYRSNPVNKIWLKRPTYLLEEAERWLLGIGLASSLYPAMASKKRKLKNGPHGIGRGRLNARGMAFGASGQSLHHVIRETFPIANFEPRLRSSREISWNIEDMRKDIALGYAKISLLHFMHSSFLESYSMLIESGSIYLGWTRLQLEYVSSLQKYELDKLGIPFSKEILRYQSMELSPICFGDNQAENPKLQRSSEIGTGVRRNAEVADAMNAMRLSGRFSMAWSYLDAEILKPSEEKYMKQRWRECFWTLHDPLECTLLALSREQDPYR